MKKIINFLLIAMVVMMPMSTYAASISIVRDANNQIPCEETLEAGVFKCTVEVDITGGNVTDGYGMKFILTPTNVTISGIEANEGWNYNSLDEVDLNNLNFTAAGEKTGKVKVFEFTYKKINTAENCSVELSVNEGESVPIIVDEPDPSTDTTVKEPDTGVTLPYIFLGGAALIAGYALIATKNKSKMHRI